MHIIHACMTKFDTEEDEGIIISKNWVEKNLG